MTRNSNYFLASNNTPLITGSSLGAGGENEAFELPDPAHCLLVRKGPIESNYEAKLEYLIANEPGPAVKKIAWPKALACDGRGQICGYTTQKCSDRAISFTELASEVTRPPWASTGMLTKAAVEASLILAELHHSGFLFPDIHGEQFRIDCTGKVMLLDAASTQFKDGSETYLCTRVRPEYQAPELFGYTNWENAAAHRNVDTDNFSLAVLIFQLAMGCLPFDGKSVGPNKTKPKDRAAQGIFPFEKSCTDCRPPANAPPYLLVAQELRDLFRLAFVDGASDPSKRPEAKTWFDVLQHCGELRKPIVQPKRSRVSPSIGVPVAKSIVTNTTSYLGNNWLALVAWIFIGAITAEFLILKERRTRWNGSTDASRHGTPIHRMRCWNLFERAR